jgi:hypothetical protein
MRSTPSHWRHSGQNQHQRHRLATTQPPPIVPTQASQITPASTPGSPPSHSQTARQCPDPDLDLAEQIDALARAIAVTAYLAAALLSLLPPLLIYLLSGSSAFARTHAAQAANVAITTALYAICSAIVGGLLAFDSIRLGIATATLGTTLFWLIALGNLIRASAAASHGRMHQIPAAFCARLLGPSQQQPKTPVLRGASGL